MVVNIVLMVEAVENARSRLLIVSLNGFPPAMSAMAVIAYLTRYWFAYHMTLALLGIVFSVLLVNSFFFYQKFSEILNNLTNIK